MQLVAGLGNPGRRYQRTRHNVGFRVIDELADRLGMSGEKNMFRAVTCRHRQPVDAIWVKPQTYMNLSGEAIRDVSGYFGIGPGDMLVVHDDLDLPLGRLRFRRKGSAGGHRGIASISRELGTDGYARLKLGIGRPPELIDAAEYVLMPFLEEERAAVDDMVRRAAEAVCVWLTGGTDEAMARFNVETSDNTT